MSKRIRVGLMTARLSKILVASFVPVMSGSAFSAGGQTATTERDRQQSDAAIVEFSKAIQRNPYDSTAYYGRSVAYEHKRDYDNAIADCNEAIRLNPKYMLAYDCRGVAYYHKGNWDKAIADYTEAIRLQPDYVDAYYNRGCAYHRRGDDEKSIADLNEAIRLGPTNAIACNNLAWTLAACPNANVRNGKKAVEYATKACELSEWKNLDWVDTLAAAYAEAGDFVSAVKWENKYLASNPSNDAWEKARQRLSLYEQKKPYHEEKP
ncbi:MAG: tetratricopeptide repeat protein [Verrucomicrobiia bacterium]